MCSSRIATGQLPAILSGVVLSTSTSRSRCAQLEYLQTVGASFRKIAARQCVPIALDILRCDA
jgi:hypothetical protein